MPLQRVPKVEIRDGEVWICVGYASTSQSLGVITSDDLSARDKYIAENERKRMAYVLDHIDLFGDFVQWRGNPPEAGKLLDNTFPWAHEAKFNAKS